MLKFLEKKSWLAWGFAFLIAGFIFYTSSLSFKGYSIGEEKAFVYHSLSFFLLSFFLAVALSKGKKEKLIILAFLIALAYAASDEFHQLFVPGRVCSFSDFLVDASGIFFGSFLYWVYLRFGRKPA